MQNHFITSYIGLGSNIGNKKGNILKALELISSDVVTVTARSHFYLTSPVDFRKQDDFINCVTKVTTLLSPLELLKYLKNIEKELGRTETVDKGPRIIDLDILLCEGVVLYTPELKIPHPSLHLRKFVLVPFAEIAPDTFHPMIGETVSSILNSLKDESKVEIIKNDAGN